MTQETDLTELTLAELDDLAKSAGPHQRRAIQLEVDRRLSFEANVARHHGKAEPDLPEGTEWGDRTIKPPQDRRAKLKTHAEQADKEEITWEKENAKAMAEYQAEVAAKQAKIDALLAESDAKAQRGEAKLGADSTWAANHQAEALRLALKALIEALR